jgi:hypothetical protein
MKSGLRFVLIANDASGRPFPVATINQPGLVHDLSLFGADCLEAEFSTDPLRAEMERGQVKVLRAAAGMIEPAPIESASHRSNVLM